MVIYMTMQGADNPSSLMMSLDPGIKQEKDGEMNMDFQENNYYGEFQYIVYFYKYLSIIKLQIRKILVI